MQKTEQGARLLGATFDLWRGAGVGGGVGDLVASLFAHNAKDAFFCKEKEGPRLFGRCFVPLGARSFRHCSVGEHCSIIKGGFVSFPNCVVFNTYFLSGR